jgi:high-affinity iron transporter
MLSALLITLREGLEAALLIGLLLAVTTHSGDPLARRRIWLGVAAAAGVSVLGGAILFATGAELEGTTEAAFEGVTMLAAALILAWMVLWMGRRAHLLRSELGDKVATAAGAGLFWLGFLLVVREGLETALFLFAAVGNEGSPAAVLGGVAGLAAAAALGYAAYRGSARLNMRVVFSVLNVLLLAFGTYLVWSGVAELGELGAGGEAGELAGPVAAVLYAAVVTWLLVRGRRAARPGRAVAASAAPATPAPTGAEGRAAAGSACPR